MKKIALIFLILFGGMALMAVEIPFKTTRLSDRVLVIGNNNNSKTMVLNTKKGLVFIDCFWSPQVVSEALKIVEKEFGKKKIILLIQTNPSILQTGGTEAFKGVERIAHEDLKRVLQERIPNLNSILKQRVKQYQDSIPRTKGQLKGVEKNSKRWVLLTNWIKTLKRWIYDMKAGYTILLPTKTFKNTLKLDLGDMNLKLIYFGQASDHGGKIIVQVEEENLLFLGDIFHSAHTLPYGPYYKKTPDVKRWIKILEGLLAGEFKWKHIVHSNGENILTKDSLKVRLRLIKDLYNRVKIAESKNTKFAELLKTVSRVKKEFPYLYGREDVSTHFLASDISNVIKGLWRINHQSGVEKIKEAYKKSGISAAKKVYQRIKVNTQDFYFTENGFNSFGYELIRESKNNDALVIFKLGVDKYPFSSNLHDSLAEAYMNNGQKELAIKNYKKSLELNPGNTNAKKMLEELKSNVLI